MSEGLNSYWVMDGSGYYRVGHAPGGGFRYVISACDAVVFLWYPDDVEQELMLLRKRAGLGYSAVRARP